MKNLLATFLLSFIWLVSPLDISFWNSSALDFSCNDLKVWNKLRHSGHPSCACDRNMEYNYNDSCPPKLVDQQILHPKQIIEKLKGMKIVFFGDSVIRQEECNFRCFLSEFYLGYEVSPWSDIFLTDRPPAYHTPRITNLYHYNVSISFFTAGGWALMDPPVGTVEMMENTDLLYMNLGNHYATTSSLKYALEEFWIAYINISPIKRPRLVIRLQNPAHFHSSTGEYENDQTGKCVIDENIPLNHTLSFRYKTIKNFVESKNLTYIDVIQMSDSGLLHPRYHDGKSCHDCLHYPQDAWILSELNTAMIEKFESLK